MAGPNASRRAACIAGRALRVAVLGVGLAAGAGLGGCTGASGPGPDPATAVTAPTSTSAPAGVASSAAGEVTGPEADAARRTVIGSDAFAAVIGETRHTIERVFPGSVGPRQDLALIVVEVATAQPVEFPLGVPTLRAVAEGDPQPRVADAVVPNESAGVRSDRFDFMVDPATDTVFATSPGLPGYVGG